MSNRYLHLIPIFSNLKYTCSSQLVTKLFDILCRFDKYKLPHELFGYIITLMIKSTYIKYINRIYSYDNNRNSFLPVTNVSHDFKIIMEKYCGTNPIGYKILEFITQTDYYLKNNIHSDKDYIHTYFETDIVKPKQNKKNTEIKKSFFDNLYDSYFGNATNYIGEEEEDLLSAIVLGISVNTDKTQIISPMYTIAFLNNNEINIEVFCSTPNINNVTSDGIRRMIIYWLEPMDMLVVTIKCLKPIYRELLIKEYYKLKKLYDAKIERSYF